MSLFKMPKEVFDGVDNIIRSRFWIQYKFWALAFSVPFRIDFSLKKGWFCDFRTLNSLKAVWNLNLKRLVLTEIGSAG